jgi:hypothetical protein
VGLAPGTGARRLRGERFIATAHMRTQIYPRPPVPGRFQAPPSRRRYDPGRRRSLSQSPERNDSAQSFLALIISSGEKQAPGERIAALPLAPGKRSDNPQADEYRDTHRSAVCSALTGL